MESLFTINDTTASQIEKGKPRWSGWELIGTAFSFYITKRWGTEQPK